MIMYHYTQLAQLTTINLSTLLQIISVQGLFSIYLPQPLPPLKKYTIVPNLMLEHSRNWIINYLFIKERESPQ